MCAAATSASPAEEPPAIGTAPVFLRLLAQVDRLAGSDRAVLICGPSGAGKEVVAQRLHWKGCGTLYPFVALNCGAIPEHLIEAELFGSARGAFTGAAADRPGLFDVAGQGTLFLDEIGEMPLALQPALLRVLEMREYRPVGTAQPRRFNGRVIAATHRNLRELVAQGRFREDLYYRLAVFELELPGLAQRREDIAALAQHFAACQKRALRFAPDALAVLERQPWPGNARQLRNLVDRLAVMCDASVVSAAILNSYLHDAPAAELAGDELAAALLRLDGADKLAAAERLLLDHAMRACEGNKSGAARLLGVSRKSVERRLALLQADQDRLRGQLQQAHALVSQSEYAAAEALLQQALARRGCQPDAQARRSLFEAHRLLAICSRNRNGWLSPDARRHDEEALAFGTGLCEPRELAALQFGIWSARLMALNLPAARATAQEMLRQAEAVQMHDLLDEAHVALANTRFWQGDCEECMALLANGGLAGSESRIGPQGYDLSALAITFDGLAACQTGDFARARDALARLRRLSGTQPTHAFNRAICLQGAAWLACLFGDTEALGMLADQLADVSERNGYTFYLGVGRIFQGCHLAALGQLEAGQQAIAEGYEHFMLRNGGHLFYSFQAWRQADILLARMRPAEALHLATLAQDQAIERQERAYLCELMDVRGRALHALGREEEAEQALHGALSTAGALGLAGPRLPIALHLAQLLADTGRGESAAGLLVRNLQDLDAAHAPPAYAQAESLLAEISPYPVPPAARPIHLERSIPCHTWLTASSSNQ